MCKRIGILLLLLCCYGFSSAQLYDAQWALGYDESVLDFRNPDTVTAYRLPTLQYFTLSNASICDENGDLLYYTNSVNVCNTSQLLTNGSLCNCLPSDSEDGLALQQTALFIPMPGSSRYYYLFHFWNDTFGYTRPGNLYYSLIDKEADNAQGAVIEQNINILSNHALKGGGMTACKHANGRDYWLVMGASQVNTYYKFLVTPEGILGPYMQDIGPDVADTGDITYSKFTMDGSRYATCFFAGPIILMDFDRCSGEFSNVTTIYNNISNDPVNVPIEGSTSVEFSPNGRFLYANERVLMNQYDLWVGNNQDSSVIYQADSTDDEFVHMEQLAPNGKLYISAWNGFLWAYHVINYPDEKGDSCGFAYGGQPTLTESTGNVPNLINYRLGALYGSGCDTITAIGGKLTENNLLRLIPNPADKYTYVEMGTQGNYEFDLLNATGQIVDKKQTRQVDIFDTEHLASGIYLIQVTNKTTNQTFTQKLVVQH